MLRTKVVLGLLFSLPLTLAQTPSPAKNDPSFFSKMTNWLFPFGNTDDLTTSETNRYYTNGFMSLPQAANSIPGDTSCNPCNKVPWIPVLANYGDNAIVGFVQPNSKPPQYLPPSSSIYNPVQRVEITGMKPPPLPQSFRPPSNYGPPPPENYGPPPKPNYGPPPLTPPETYGPPQAYGPPPQTNYGPPKPNYGFPPLKPNYGAPPPPKPSFIPPPKTNYASPPFLNQIVPPKPHYGQPSIRTYGVPPKMKLIPLNQNYDPYSSSTHGLPSFIPGGQPNNFQKNYPLPSQDYSPPLVNSYGTPVSHTNILSSEPIGMKPPPFQPPYDIPSVNLPVEENPPLPEYPPIGQPVNSYQTPQESQEVNVVASKEIQINIESSSHNPSVSSYDDALKDQNSVSDYENQNGEQALASEESKFALYVPVAEGAVKKLNEEKEKFSQTIQPLERDIFKSGEVDAVQSVIPNYTSNSYTGDQEITAESKHTSSLQIPYNHNPDYTTSNSSEQNKSSRFIPGRGGQYTFTSDSGSLQIAPVHFSRNLHHHSNNFNGFGLATERTMARQHGGFYKFINPIPFPQLSASQVVPVRKPVNFISNSIQQENKNSPVQPNNIQVLPSIQVASYLSTIEHPVTVVQSSLIDINATDVKFEEDNKVAENRNNPINTTVLNTVQTNDSFSANSKFIAYPTNSTDSNRDQHKTEVINILNYLADSTRTKFEHQQELHQHNTKKNSTVFNFSSNASEFKPPPMDYSNWTPTLLKVGPSIPTSMMPPGRNEHVWLTAKGKDQVLYDPLNKKHAQIIIPYIPKSPTPFKLKETMQTKRPDIMPNTNPMSSVLLKESVWSQFTKDYAQEESQKIHSSVFTERPYVTTLDTETTLVTEEHKTTVHSNRNNSELPFDIIRLQKNIDDWTEQEFSKKFVDVNVADIKNKISSTKSIPSVYLQFQQTNQNETTTTSSTTDSKIYTTLDNDKTISKLEDEINNFILDDDDVTTTAQSPVTDSTTPIPTTLTESFSVEEKPFWEHLQVSISPLTNEKVYVVTPLPLSQNISEEISRHEVSRNQNGTGGDAFSVLKLLFSEWPHHINDLETTTSTPNPDPNFKVDHLDLVNAERYTATPSLRVETLTGHSKVSIGNLPSTEPSTVSSPSAKNITSIAT
ncbi:uncharacterized protein LOC108736681 [Agrilus planipennis]|uniref:Uncharacterized protein LOC108736681 n=1 Tax=Agrilus planipennis TaxID=224129 RepID=A0A1W4WL91_AGRPL|nr:uncharacterized protein LOC108736681 [Agrilus planipennis]XP_018324701.1 uncharacterized protein LOC108736681 [Agrilus planipennis]XP_018324705.1 uncharacterized protein LOC108736681 [Agrilus planipennis]XP_025831711.1 uncharacterized protein LOC108736681 [Agrilus planipennis]XP_025831712.1 uncharacterized protein LOC108736681 [Agrilus planipennis]XP_025831713.1 uncharacterized protein LOC108736681 [Agrilus planipennis]